LTDFLLPGLGSRKIKIPTTNISESNKTDGTVAIHCSEYIWEILVFRLDYFFYVSDESLREELHEMLIPAILRPSRCKLDCSLNLHFYYIEFIPSPADRRYQMFGLFVINPLPKEAEKLDVELHLARARIVRAGIKSIGTIGFNKEEALSPSSVDSVQPILLSFMTYC
jgi:endoribonuclease Dicer